VASAEPAVHEVAQLHNVDDNSTLFSGQPENQQGAANYSHDITELSEGFVATASYDTVPVAAAEHSQSKIYGVTWNPAAEGSSLCQAVLKNFYFIAAELSPDWSISQVFDHQNAKIREQIGD